MPGEVMSTTKYVMPLCLATSGSVRAMRIPHAARCPNEVQIFWPLTTHSSPSRTARVVRLARSEPASGSLKSWHHMSSAESKRGSQRRCCSSVPAWSSVGPAQPIPIGLLGRRTPARLSSSSITNWSIGSASSPYGRGQCGAT